MSQEVSNRPIVMIAPRLEGPVLRQALEATFPARRILEWPERDAAAEALICFRPPPGIFAALPGLRLVQGSGAGVDTILRAPDLPAHLPVCRVVDPAPAFAMARHVAHAVLRILGRHATYDAQQRAGQWNRMRLRPAAESRVTVLGLGHIGMVVAQALAALGLPVTGWSRSPRALPGVTTRHGAETLDEVLRAADVLVVLLPGTPETRGLLDAQRLALLPRGAALVHVGRGGQVVEADMIAALDAGHLAAAHCDVFATEPLPEGDPLWTHPKVTVTPHIASPPDGGAVARSLAAALAALDAGKAPAGLVDRTRGY